MEKDERTKTLRKESIKKKKAWRKDGKKALREDVRNAWRKEGVKEESKKGGKMEGGR